MVKIKKLKKKNFYYSYVIGRFSPMVGSKFQHFPIDNWEKDLKIAKKFNFDGTEWIISDYSNPIFNILFCKIIKQHLKKNNLRICSLSLDLIMDNPLHKISTTDVEWLIKKLRILIKYFSIKRVTIPIEEKSRFNNYIEKNIALNRLKKFYSGIGKLCNLSIETDISPFNLKKLFNLKSLKKLGILLDIGNTKAHGFKVEDYIKLFANKIYGVHIKYRPEFYSKTARLKKNFKELKILLENIKKLKNCRDITFQTYKSNNNFFKDMEVSINNFNKHV